VSDGVFLDSGIFIAFLNRRDRWHGAAVSLFNRESSSDWSTSWLVVSETYSWFLHRMGEESARTFRRFLSSLEGLRVFAATGEHHLRVVATLDRFRGSKLTYVDASSLALLEDHGIRRVWSTDRHLGLGGVEVLPRN
jgi:predicted nucleic acid-binding protein